MQTSRFSADSDRIAAFVVAWILQDVLSSRVACGYPSSRPESPAQELQKGYMIVTQL